eukprot:4203642-Prymnesium_polylepis.1
MRIDCDMQKRSPRATHTAGGPRHERKLDVGKTIGSVSTEVMRNSSTPTPTSSETVLALKRPGRRHHVPLFCRNARCRRRASGRS